MQVQPQSKRTGFTLVELLVVIVVIMILARLLFPALNSVREAGKSTRCKSNLRQLQVAALQYAVDSGGNLPCAASYNDKNSLGTWDHHQGWLEWAAYTHSPSLGTAGNYSQSNACIANGALFAYVRSTGVYACPSRTNVWAYSMNATVSGASFINNAVPANTLLFGDSAVATVVGPSSAGFYPVANATRVKIAGQLWNHPRSGKANAVFLDGHVESF